MPPGKKKSKFGKNVPKKIVFKSAFDLKGRLVTLGTEKTFVNQVLNVGSSIVIITASEKIAQIKNREVVPVDARTRQKMAKMLELLAGTSGKKPEFF